MQNTPKMRKMPRSKTPEQNNMRAAASELLNWIAMVGLGALILTNDKPVRDPRLDTPTITEPLKAPAAGSDPHIPAIAAQKDAVDDGPEGVLIGRIPIRSPQDSGEPLPEAVSAHNPKVDSLIAEMHSYTQELATAEGKARVPMLTEKSIRTACRFTSDWFIKDSKNLGDVFTYLEKTNGAWTPEFTGAVKKILDESSGYIKDDKELMSMVKAKLAEGKPFKCGIMLNLAAFKLESFQALGITFLTEAATFIKHDLEHGTDEQKAEAAKASEALLRSLASAMGDK